MASLNVNSILSFLLTFLFLVATASATNGASTTSVALFYEHTLSSSPKNCTSTYTKWVPTTNPTEPATHSRFHSWTFIPGTASVYRSGSPIPSISANGTYHSPTISSSTTSTTVAPSSSGSSESTQAASTSQNTSPTTSGPSEPLFTAGAGLTSRLPDMQVWKWNVGVSVLLGLMVMWI